MSKMIQRFGSQPAIQSQIYGQHQINPEWRYLKVSENRRRNQMIEMSILLRVVNFFTEYLSIS